MAELRPSPGLRAVVRILLVLAFAVLILGFLISGVAQITDALIQDTIDDVTTPEPAANNTTSTTSDTIAAPTPPQTTGCASLETASAGRLTFSRAHASH